MITVGWRIPAKRFTERTCKGSILSVFLMAESAVNTYIMDDANLAAYERGRTFRHHGPGTVTIFGSLVQMPDAGPWHVVIENPHAASVHVDQNIHAL